MKRADIERLLPTVFRDTLPYPGNPLEDFLAVMEDLHAPAEAILKDIARFFDPYETPDRFVPYLATWVDLERLLYETPYARTPSPWPSGNGRLRELIAAAAYLSEWRGTSKGLLRFLEVATGMTGFGVTENPDGRPFHVHFQLPPGHERYRDLIKRIIEQEKPAYVTYDPSLDPPVTSALNRT
jgi:phage tail-like protein